MTHPDVTRRENDNAQLTVQQAAQEEVYAFPYHYIGIHLEEYRALKDIEYIAYLDTVKNLLAPFTGQLVIDAGCGDGRFCYHLKNENVKLIGTDYSTQALRFAKAFNPEIRFIHADLEKLKIDEKADAIVLIETLEHIKPNKVQTVIANLARVIKPNGKLVLTVPSIKARLHTKHYQHFSEQTLRDAVTPHFSQTSITGYRRAGIGYGIFKLARKFLLLAFPLRNRLPFVRPLCAALKSFYLKRIASGKPEECLQLIAICQGPRHSTRRQK